ncbi:MAG: riboflavin synthase [Candidatus Marinimicrobia bacterium]|jgi:riboflavin synthase|nr:riboflavin synthase [Candidatus Neomarinimicrobiota bacterium]
MFTGLIEEIGTIENIVKQQDKINLSIKAKKILTDTKIDDSISINGICLTVVDIKTNSFAVQAVRETMQKSTIANWRKGEFVNLERAMKINDRLGGHIVQGHIDGIGTIDKITKLSDTLELEIILPTGKNAYTIERGSIAIDGISLTIAKKTRDKIRIAVIPHTLNNTTIKDKKVNDKINIEFDFFAKYIQNYLDGTKGVLTESKLKSWGYER